MFKNPMMMLMLGAGVLVLLTPMMMVCVSLPCSLALRFAYDAPPWLSAGEANAGMLSAYGG